MDFTFKLHGGESNQQSFRCEITFRLLSTTYFATFQKISPVRMEAPPTQNFASGGGGEPKISPPHPCK